MNHIHKVDKETSTFLLYFDKNIVGQDTLNPDWQITEEFKFNKAKFDEFNRRRKQSAKYYKPILDLYKQKKITTVLDDIGFLKIKILDFSIREKFKELTIPELAYCIYNPIQKYIKTFNKAIAVISKWEPYEFSQDSELFTILLIEEDLKNEQTTDK